VKISSTSQLDRALGAGPLLPVYLVSAEEPLTGGEAADAIRAAARRQGFEEREVYAVERTAPWGEILASAQSMSLFSARKLIEVRMPGGKPGHGAKTLVEVIRAAGPDVLVMILTDRLDFAAQKAEWVAAAGDAGAWVDLPPIDTARFPAWIRARAKQQGLELDDDGVALLAARTEGNLLAAHQEIQKLVLGGHAQAGAAEVLASVAASSRFDVFQLGQALLAGEAPRALRILASLEGEGTEPTLVLWAILQEMRNLWLKLVPGAPIPGVWSSNAAQLPHAISRFRAAPSPRALFMRLAERASRADRMIKGRLSGNPWDEITQLALELAGVRVLPLTKI
jgi:DNA polymerase-3 subunit delta